MAAVAQPRLPFAPLLRASGALEAMQVVEYVRSDGRRENRSGEPRRWSALSEVTGVSVRQLHRWGREGVPLRQADRLAVAVGCHPGELWDEWWSVTVGTDADDGDHG